MWWYWVEYRASFFSSDEGLQGGRGSQEKGRVTSAVPVPGVPNLPKRGWGIRSSAPFSLPIAHGKHLLPAVHILHDCNTTF